MDNNIGKGYYIKEGILIASKLLFIEDRLIL